VKLLLRNCYAILAPEHTRYPQGSHILINDGVIGKIVPSVELNPRETKETETIDCSHFVVVPGFVNTHHHFYQTLTRNIPAVQNKNLFPWLVHLYDVWKHIDEEAVYYATLVAAGELLKTGCTCSTDHHYLYPKGISGDLMGIQFDAARRLGMRFSPCRGSMSLSVKDGGLPPDSVVQTEDEILTDSRRVIEQYHDPSDRAMQKVLLAPCSPFSVSEGLMKETVALARSMKVRLHTHLAETEDETSYCLTHYGKRPLVLMQELDFIGEDVSFAHGVFFTDDELDTLKETKTSICHCPTSNMRLGSGIARVEEMRRRGINVTLAVDGSASNDTSDFLGEMRNAMLLQRVKYGAGALTAADVYDMATLCGARCLGFGNIGAIKEGWAADLALFDINRLEYAGALSDPFAALIFSGISHQTAFTIVNGRVVVSGGRLTGVDEEQIIDNANRISWGLLA